MSEDTGRKNRDELIAAEKKMVQEKQARFQKLERMTQSQPVSDVFKEGMKLVKQMIETSEPALEEVLYDSPKTNLEMIRNENLCQDYTKTSADAIDAMLSQLEVMAQSFSK